MELLILRAFEMPMCIVNRQGVENLCTMFSDSSHSSPRASEGPVFYTHALGNPVTIFAMSTLRVPSSTLGVPSRVLVDLTLLFNAGHTQRIEQWRKHNTPVSSEGRVDRRGKRVYVKEQVIPKEEVFNLQKSG